ncbi:MAG TPA: PIN domain-containing protein, partial [Polyangiaceae bacterium]|nr:PIN domain-containing protein [Polyangiaceae bacterium]
MAEAIDPKRLPVSVLFDTSTLIAASDGRVRKDQEQACAPLLDALVAAKRAVMIAAPSFAEFLRKAPRTPSPRLAGIDVVAFDRIASELLAAKFPKQVLTQYRDQSTKGKPPLDYIKYDAMIVACAVR